MYESIGYHANGTASISGVIPRQKRYARSERITEKKRISLSRAGEVFSGIALICFLKWMLVMLGTPVGSGIQPEEIVALITAMVSCAAAAICMIWKEEA